MTYVAEIERVIDGDTMKMRINLGFNVHIIETVRLARVQAPELSDARGFAAKDFTLATLSDVIALKVEPKRKDNYGRWVCEVTFQLKGKEGTWLNISDILLEKKVARLYSA